MNCIDLVSSISHALPQLVAASARRASDQRIFEPTIGYALIRPARSGAREQFAVDTLEAWPSLTATTLGIIGSGPIGQTVARITRQRFGAQVGYHPSVPLPDSDFEAGVRSQSLDDVLSARVICIVLPWSHDLPAQVQQSKFSQVNPEFILVVWKRSLAIERALVYLGKHYVESVDLSSLAEVACMSKYQLVRLFTATLGISPHRYQLWLRLSKAKGMLREGTCITQIAHGLGFSDHSHLNRSFRILLGMTPTQYQQRVAC
jgi:AraC-like DNA-binding protein